MATLSMQELQVIAEEMFATDLPIPPEAVRWSREAAARYFESGGFDVPDVESAPSAAKVSGSAAEFSGPPVLVAWAGGGSDKQSSRQQLTPLFTASREVGLQDQLLLYLAHEYPECTSWSQYVDRQLEEIDASADRRGRPLLLFAFSSGAGSAHAIAGRLGARVLKVVIAGMRPTFNVLPGVPPSSSEAFGGVSSPEEFAALSWEACADGIATTWAPILKPLLKVPRQRWPAVARVVVDEFRKLYSLSFYPGFTETHALPYGGVGPKMMAPLAIVAGAAEEARGERPSKMDGWKDLTSATCVIHAVEGATHTSILIRTGEDGGRAFDLIVRELQIATVG